MKSEQAHSNWRVDGDGPITDAQRRMLNAVCSDLSRQITWFGNRLDKDDWRHMLCGTVLGWRGMPGIDRGEGPRGMIYLGGSSLKLSKNDARDAITQAIQIGDHPSEQGLECQPVRWSDAVMLGMKYNEDDLRRAER